MKRNGPHLLALGDLARSPNTSLDSARLPNAARPAYGAFRSAARSVSLGVIHTHEETGKLDPDLTPQARERRVQEIHARHAKVTGELLDAARAAFMSYRETVTGAVHRAQNQNPLDELRGESKTERLLHILVSNQYEEKADRLLGPAMKDGTGAKLLDLHERVEALGDRTFLAAFEASAKTRLEVEGSESQRESFAFRLEEVSEARLGDPEHQALDHVDALTTLSMLTEQSAQDPKNLKLITEYFPGILADGGQ